MLVSGQPSAATACDHVIPCPWDSTQHIPRHLLLLGDHYGPIDCWSIAIIGPSAPLGDSLTRHLRHPPPPPNLILTTRLNRYMYSMLLLLSFYGCYYLVLIVLIRCHIHLAIIPKNTKITTTAILENQHHILGMQSKSVWIDVMFSFISTGNHTHVLH